MDWTSFSAGAGILLVGTAGAALGILLRQWPEQSPVIAEPAVIAEPPVADRMDRRDPASGLDVASLPTTDWVSLYDPERAWAGYTLVFYERRVPMLVDMNGRVVHSWPDVRAVGRARLTPSGSLLYISVDDSLVEIDWDGHPVRKYNTGEHTYFPHHDLQWAPGDELVGIFRAPGKPTDNILIVDASSEVVWTWESQDHLSDDFTGEVFNERDLTHFNSVQVIPDNPRARGGDARFTAGNVLISSRHLSTIYLIDRASGKVTWKHSKDLDWQHEAVLLGDDVPGAGNVLLFNNRYHSKNRQSEVLEIDPAEGSVVWRYTSENFFSDTAGTAQKLPNGNVLITSSRGGRVFEVTPDADAEIVWQWTPPFNPMRTQRYPADFCPQLAALPPMQTSAVADRLSGPHIDEALYSFALSREVVKNKIAGKKRRLLEKANHCQDLMLPGKPTLILEYGFSNAQDLRPADSTGRLTVTLARPGAEPETVYEKMVSYDVDGEWSRERVRLDRDWGQASVEMCVRSSAPDLTRATRDPTGFVVAGPRIVTGDRPSRRGLPRVNEPRNKEAKAKERTLQQRQLEALGYIE